MNRRFEDILDECVDRVLQGESVEQCLQRYPEQARELEPLLRLAAAAGKASSAVEPRPEFKSRTRYEVQSRLRAGGRTAGAKRTPVIGWVPRWAVAVVSVVFVLLLAGTSTVAASTGTVPGDTLYPVKTAAEQVQLKLTFSEEARARLEARFAERRAWEMARLAESGDAERLRGLGARFGEHLAEVEGFAARTEAGDAGDGEQVARLRETLYANMARDLARIDAAEEKAPPRARAAIAVAKFRLMARYEKAIAALDEVQNQPPAETGSTGGTEASGETAESGSGDTSAEGSGGGSGSSPAGPGQPDQTTGTGLQAMAPCAG